MRRLLVAGFMMIVAHGAHAADPPVLRGSFREPPPAVAYRTVWQGFYAGGQYGYGASSMDFADLNVTGWPPLGEVTHRASMFGGFAGYNWQWEDVVIGMEGNYMHGTFSSSALGSSTTITPNIGPLPGLDRVVTMTSDGAQTIKDFGSLRVRGGYVAGNFLPYLFAGIGMGRADTLRNISITGTYVGTTALNGVSGVPRTTTLSSDTNNQLVYGFAAGGGLDWMVFGGLFVRAEYEYMQFTSTLNTNIHSIRGGVGYKF